ncbi:MAG: SNF2 helicase associated domain-containing protein, partial [Clostridia bacterium]|nr:SNF2 helicase associated domain-containing protein [Clostridia bacterium]
MYTRLQLQSACASRVDFQHGLDYYNEERNERFACIDLANPEKHLMREISSSVKGTHDVYSARAVIDEVDDKQGTGKLVSCICSCPGSNEKDRICKHCIALVLKYIDMRDSGRIVDTGSAEVQLEDIPLETDQSFLNMLTSEKYRRHVEIAARSRESCLRLVPFLTVTDSTIFAEFKAGDSKLYIVKDIAGYASAVLHNKSINYGKNKAIVHSVSLFDEPGRKLIMFLERYRKNRHTYVKSYSAAKSEDDLRFLNIKNELIDRFFECMIGENVNIADRTSYNKNRDVGITVTDPVDAEDAKNAAQTEKSEASAADDSFFSNDVVKPVFREYKVVKGLPELSFTVTGLDTGALITGSFMPVFIGLDSAVFFAKDTVYVSDVSQLGGTLAFFKYMASSSPNGIFISEKDLPLFVPDLLKELKELFDVTFVDFNENAYMPKEASMKFYVDMPYADVISCQLFACYGEGEEEKRYNVLAERDYTGSSRDEAAETAAYESLKKYFNKYDPNLEAAIMAKGDEAFYEFITSQVYELELLGEVFISEKLRNVKVKKASRISVGVSLQGDLLMFSVHSDDFTPDQLAELLKKYDRKKKFFRLTDGTFINVDGEGVKNLVNVGKMLEMSGISLSGGTAVVPKFRALYLDSELSDNENVLISRSRDFKALIRNMKTFEDNDFDVPVSLKDTLRNYQKYGFRWLKTLRQNGFGGILADEMGLGKTVQAIAFLKSEYEEGAKSGTLIVCPASLVYNWKSELERFAPNLSSVVVSGKQEERADTVRNLKPGDVVITSYDLLRRDVRLYSEKTFGYQIIDEAQYIKNSATLSSKAVKQIRSDFRLALTGTPIENKLSELWSIFDYLMPGFLHDYRQFKEEYETPIVSFKDNDALIRLRKIIHPFILRRLKQDVLRDLPDKLEETLTTKLTDAQDELYRANLASIRQSLGRRTDDKSGVTVQILAELMKLRQICCDPSLIYDNYEGGAAKVDLCVDLVKGAIEGNHKVLIFSQFTSMLSIIEKRF